MLPQEEKAPECALIAKGVCVCRLHSTHGLVYESGLAVDFEEAR